jgi:hypothetical protein
MLSLWRQYYDFRYVFVLIVASRRPQAATRVQSLFPTLYRHDHWEKQSDSFNAMAAEKITWEPNEEDRAANDPTLPLCSTVENEDIKELAEESNLGKMMHLKVLKIKIEATMSPDGHPRCIARLDTSAGDKVPRFYFAHGSDNRNFISGSWIK